MQNWLTLRAAVSFCGEKPQNQWWDTSFLNETGRSYLAYLYPRSLDAAALFCASRAAQQFHDERIGKGRVYHLFRLPYAMERQIHEATLHSRSLADLWKSPEHALHQLETLARDTKGKVTVEGVQGPVQVGASNILNHEDSLALLATYYLDAFRNDKQVLPYFAVAE